MKKKGMLAILCLLLSLCIMACGSASSDKASAAEAAAPSPAPAAADSPSPAPAAAVPTPTPTPAVSHERLEELAAALNEELRIADEKAEKEALEEHRKETGEDTGETKVERNVLMHYTVTEDGRICLNLCDFYISAIVKEYLSAPEGADSSSFQAMYYQYIKMLPGLQKITGIDVATREPGVEAIVVLYADKDYQFRLAQAEDGQLSYDFLTAARAEAQESAEAPAA